MKRSLLFLISSLILFSCSETRWARVTVNNVYSLELPTFLEPGTFYPEASLQYKNEEKEFYLIVIDESKAQFKEYGLDYDLNTYFTNTARKFDSVSVLKPGKLILGADTSLASEFSGKINGNDVCYKIFCVESPLRFYKILIWMRMADKDKYASITDKIIRSFREAENKNNAAAPPPVIPADSARPAH